MGTYGIPDNPGRWTSSRLRAWWLESLWGYKVLRVKRRPRYGWFGKVDFEEEYLLCPRDRAARH